MIKIENFEVVGWEHAIRGMRNPMNSWEKSDTKGCTDHDFCAECPACDDLGHCNKPFYSEYVVGPNDHELMMKLAKGGPVHAKYRRMITVYVDITAPLYWWAELDTYKVGTVRNSCSFMHKGVSKPFEISDFSIKDERIYKILAPLYKKSYEQIIETLNYYRTLYLETKDDQVFQAIRALLPQGYLQKSTMMLNYEVLHNIYISRKNHRLDEWRELCAWIESLPYSEIIVGEKEKE